MKVLHDTLDALLADVTDLKVPVVRVCTLVQSAPTSPVAGVPQLTVRIVVTAMLDERLWAEWRWWVGRSLADVGERGLRLPETLGRRAQERLAEVRSRIAAAGLRVREGMLAEDGTSMDAFRA